MKQSSKRLSRVFGTDDGLADQSSTTKLYREDFKEVQQLCAGGQTHSEVLRNLIHKGLQRDRYKRAASDPAMRELLRTYDELLTHRLAETEARVRPHLSAEAGVIFEVLRRLLRPTLFTADALGTFITDVMGKNESPHDGDYYASVFDEIDEESVGALNELKEVRQRKLDEVPVPRQQLTAGEQDSEGDYMRTGD
jgi:hypothetical protein